jgi:hypothetical protein
MPMVRQGNQRKGHLRVDCFIKYCDEEVVTAGCTDGEQQGAWREHLLSHNPEALLNFGLSHQLLQEDEKQAQGDYGSLVQCRDLFPQVFDQGLADRVNEALDPSHRDVWHQLVHFLGTPVYQL